MIGKIDHLIKIIQQSKRPAILVGNGINISNTNKELIKFVNKNHIPVVSAWSLDAFPNFHKYYFGRQGSIGNRVGNYVVQFADVLIVLGSRLNIRQVSYNWKDFAKNAKIISVDIDPAEQRKGLVIYDYIFTCDLREFFKKINKKTILIEKKNKIKWLKWILWCKFVRKKLTPKIDDYKIYQNKINVYHFIIFLFKHLRNKEIIVAADGAATVVPNQVGYLNKGVRYFANSGSASMGFDLPGSIGAAIASPNKKIICLAGDGSIMMNIQELQTIKDLGLNILIFVINNDGYLSIKQTQNNFFKREFGASSNSDLSFPDFKKVAKAFGINSYSLNLGNWEKKIKMILKKKGPLLVELKVDTIQEFEPKLKSVKLKNKIITPSLENMYPFLDKELQNEIILKLNEC